MRVTFSIGRKPNGLHVSWLADLKSDFAHWRRRIIMPAIQQAETALRFTNTTFCAIDYGSLLRRLKPQSCPLHSTMFQGQLSTLQAFFTVMELRHHSLLDSRSSWHTVTSGAIDSGSALASKIVNSCRPLNTSCFLAAIGGS